MPRFKCPLSENLQDEKSRETEGWDEILWEPGMKTLRILECKSSGSWDENPWDPGMEILGILEWKSLGSWDGSS